MKNNQPTDSYRIIRKVECPSEEVGQSVAVKFDYGPVHSDAFGEANLDGTFLCFTPYEDTEEILEERVTTTMATLMLSIAEEADSVGLNFSELVDTKTGSFTKGFQTDKMMDVYTVLYHGVPLEHTKLYIYIGWFGELMEEVIDKWVDGGIDLKPFIELAKACLDGRWTHLNQINPPKYLELPLANLILLRRAALDSKIPEGWQYLKKDLMSYFWGSYKEGTRDYRGIEEYMHFRDFSAGSGALFEGDWMCRGIRIPENVREDPEFAYFKHQSGIFAALANDICGLKKELIRGEGFNLVVLLAQTMSLQEAIHESSKVMERIFFKVQAAAAGLIRTFPNEPSVKQLISSAGRCCDYVLIVQEALFSRYGIEEGCSSYWVVEFDETYNRMVEANLKQAVDGDTKHSSPINDEILAILSKGSIDKDDFLKNNRDTGDLTAEKLNSLIIQEEKIPEVPKGIIPVDQCPIKHLAIIPDGNRRWAKERGYPPWKGHEVSKNILMELAIAVWKQGIHTATVWALSYENFQRPKEELEQLWILLESGISDLRNKAKQYDARVCHIGHKNRLPPRIKRMLETVEKETIGYTGRRFNLAIDYSGREDILQAFLDMDKTASAKDIGKQLWGGDQLYPEPDLIIRTGCKDADTVRMSGFMIWEAVYAELYFEKKYTPEIEEEDIIRWVDAYKKAQRRFGK